MLSSNGIKFYRSLHQKKYREREKLFLAEGTRVIEGIPGSGFHVADLLATRDWLDKHQGIWNRFTPEPKVATKKDLARISTQKTPQEAIAVVRKPQRNAEPEFPTDHPICFLHGIQDPGNLGTIIRTADHFGMPFIAYAPDTVDPFNPKVVRGSMGSLFHMKLLCSEAGKIMEHYREQGGTVIALTKDGASLFKTDALSNPMCCFLLGNEGAGLPDEVAGMADQRVSIPRYGQAESLNASVVAGVVMAQWVAKYHPS